MKSFILVLLLVGTYANLACQEIIQENESLSFEEYNPVSTLKVRQTIVTRAKFPFIDVHNHQWRMPTQNLHELASEMDSLNMAVMINLSGKPMNRTAHLKKAIENVKNNQPDRFIIFTNVDFSSIDDPNWGSETAELLENEVKLGANGLKIYKELGLFYKDKFGNRIPVNDPRIDPVWDKCGELGIPVLIHSAAPPSFWEPFDKNNERWLELKQFPDRRYPMDQFAPWKQIIGEQHDVFAKHPNTIFINAHLGWMGNDLSSLGKLLDRYPNVYTEIGAVLAELGRQPVSGRKFFIKYQDRILFGKDTWRPEEYYVYFRVLETEDEYFDYYRRRHAFWKMYGLNLPDEVLKKVYYKNALKIIPNISNHIFEKLGME